MPSSAELFAGFEKAHGHEFATPFLLLQAFCRKCGACVSYETVKGGKGEQLQCVGHTEAGARVREKLAVTRVREAILDLVFQFVETLGEPKGGQELARVLAHIMAKRTGLFEPSSFWERIPAPLDPALAALAAQAATDSKNEWKGFSE